LVLTNRYSLISCQLGSHQQVLTDQLAAWFSPTSQQLVSHQVAENQIRTNQLAGGTVMVFINRLPDKCPSGGRKKNKFKRCVSLCTP
jgi:hypothetical protein